MTAHTKYVLDANCLIRAKREHYAFDFCPAFWDFLLRANAHKRVLSINPIRSELIHFGDDLSEWVKNQAPEDFFESIEDQQVDAVYREIMEWIDANEQYLRAAKDHFASGADPWLVAAAKARNYVLVTHEVPAPESKSSIKIPDVASRFTVQCKSPFQMLRELNAVFKLE